MNVIEKFYDDQSNYEWERLERHRTDFTVMMRALLDFLPEASATILDIGGGPGRYAIMLAQLGYSVTLVDLSQGNLNLAREKAEESSVVLDDFVHANALDLACFSTSSYDAVLLLGPLYHLLAHEERLQVVSDAKRILKCPGCIFASFITRFAVLRDVVKCSPDRVIRFSQSVEQILTTGIMVRL